jgi:protein-tyrosine-phosphatase
MAARILSSLVAKNSESALWRSESAGIWTVEGASAALRANQAMKQLGLELDGHRSRSVTLDMLRSFKLVMTMERGQQEALRIEFPALRNRIFCLSELVGQHWDLLDPPSGDLADYTAVAKQIQRTLEAGFSTLKRLARVDGTDTSI